MEQEVEPQILLRIEGIAWFVGDEERVDLLVCLGSNVPVRAGTEAWLS